MQDATMRTEMDCAQIRAVIAGLESAWNRADDTAFGSYFDKDADFVNINGLHARGRRNIAEGHDHIFRTIYAGSAMRYSLAQVRFIREEVALVHLNAVLKVPAGPMAGEIRAIPSLLMQCREAGWSITALHNTVVRQPDTAS
jgi:uncharacterized protein (TIGR02246 family)